MSIASDVPLAPMTTLELGGSAHFFSEASDEASLRRALEFATDRSLPVLFVGGGSNLVIGDAGFPGLVIRIASRGLRFDAGRVTIAAGEPWDGVVERAVEAGWCGIEALSGIPGSAGATPIQNVGAYGQEVGSTLVAIRAFDRERAAIVELAREDLGLGYRDSRLKRAPGRFVVLELTLELSRTPPRIAYAELAAKVTDNDPRAVRAAVLALRRQKSMVIDPTDPNRRSVGSFFMNPIVDRETADRVEAIARAEGKAMPRFPAADGVKIPAAWLIEQAGFTKGQRDGPVGLSSRHALALVHHGGGTTEALLDFARRIRDAVRLRFGVTIVPEAVIVGTTWS